MGFDAWFTLGTIGLVMAALVTNRMQVDTAMLGGLILLMVVGVVEFTQAVSGFASTAVLMVGGLFVVAAGLEETGALSLFSDRLLGRPRNITQAQFRLLPPVALRLVRVKSDCGAHNCLLRCDRTRRRQGQGCAHRTRCHRPSCRGFR